MFPYLSAPAPVISVSLKIIFINKTASVQGKSVGFERLQVCLPPQEGCAHYWIWRPEISFGVKWEKEKGYNWLLCDSSLTGSISVSHRALSLNSSCRFLTLIQTRLQLESWNALSICRFVQHLPPNCKTIIINNQSDFTKSRFQPHLCHFSA